jgi:hypothetical protein
MFRLRMPNPSAPAYHPRNGQNPLLSRAILGEPPRDIHKNATGPCRARSPGNGDVRRYGAVGDWDGVQGTDDSGAVR